MTLRLATYSMIGGLMASLTAFAADSKERVDAPVAGYSFDGGELRAMLGVPGAVRWSDPLALPEGTVALRLAPGHRLALVQKENGEVGVFSVDTLAYRALGTASLDNLAFSPSGVYAVARGVYMAGLNGAQPEMKLDAGLTADRMAISDAGTVAFAAEGRLVRGGVQLGECGDTCAFAFVSGSEAMAVVNGQTLLEYDRDGAPRVIASNVDATLVAADATTVVTATAERVTAWDRTTGTLVRDEAAQVAKLEASRLAGSYILSDGDGAAPLWMYTSDGIRLAPVRKGAVKE